MVLDLIFIAWRLEQSTGDSGDENVLSEVYVSDFLIQFKGAIPKEIVLRIFWIKNVVKIKLNLRIFTHKLRVSEICLKHQNRDIKKIIEGEQSED